MVNDLRTPRSAHNLAERLGLVALLECSGKISELASSEAMQTNALKLSILASLFTGCVMDDAATDDPPTDLSSVSSNISVAGGATWSGSTELKLGPTSQQTCFLSGVTGELKGKLDQFEGILNEGVAAVRHHDGFWWIHVEKGAGTGVQARAVCVNIPFNPGLTMAWGDNIPAGSSVPVAPHRHCYLSEIWATYGLDGTKEPLINDPVRTGLRITNDGNSFRMDDSYVDLGGYGRNGGGGSAVCFDYDGSAAFAETISAPPLFVAPPVTIKTGSGSTFSVANSTCGLTELVGNWSPIADEGEFSFGLQDGVLMDNDPADTSVWTVSVTNDHSGRVSCVR